MIELETANCSCCGSSSRRTLYAYGDWRYGIPEPKYGVCICSKCGHGYLSPRPTESTIHEAYPTDYDAARSTTNHETATRYAAQATFVGPGIGRLLDVGSARGDFLNSLLELGWDATGIDPFLRDGASNARLLKADIYSDLLSPDTFDVVTAWHVVEHVYRPKDFFVRVSELLKPGGRFCMSVPNFKSYRARWLKAEDVPRHLQFFTIDSLIKLGESCNLLTQRVSYNAAFANGAVGRGALTNYVHRYLGGVTLFDYLRSRTVGAGLPQVSSSLINLLVRPINKLEKAFLNEGRLEKSGRMGVVAVEFKKISGM